MHAPFGTRLKNVQSSLRNIYNTCIVTFSSERYSFIWNMHYCIFVESLEVFFCLPKTGMNLIAFSEGIDICILYSWFQIRLDHCTNSPSNATHFHYLSCIDAKLQLMNDFAQKSFVLVARFGFKICYILFQ